MSEEKEAMMMAFYGEMIRPIYLYFGQALALYISKHDPHVVKVNEIKELVQRAVQQAESERGERYTDIEREVIGRFFDVFFRAWSDKSCKFAHYFACRVCGLNPSNPLRKLD